MPDSEKRLIPSEQYIYSWSHLIDCVDDIRQMSTPGQPFDLITETDEKDEKKSEAVIGIRTKKNELIHRLSALAAQANFFEEHKKIVPLLIGEEAYTSDKQVKDIKMALELSEDHPAHQYAKIYLHKFNPPETLRIYPPAQSNAEFMSAPGLAEITFGYLEDYTDADTLKQAKEHVKKALPDKELVDSKTTDADKLQQLYKDLEINGHPDNAYATQIKICNALGQLKNEASLCTKQGILPGRCAYREDPKAKRVIDLCIGSIAFLTTASILSPERGYKLQNCCLYALSAVAYLLEKYPTDESASYRPLVPALLNQIDWVYLGEIERSRLIIILLRSCDNEKILEFWLKNHGKVELGSVKVSASVKGFRAFFLNEATLSSFTLASLLNPSVCDELLYNWPNDTAKRQLVTALTELNQLSDDTSLTSRYMTGTVKPQECMQTRLRLLLRLEAYPDLKYQYTDKDKQILEKHLCDVVRSLTTVDDVIKFYDRQEQHAFWKHKQNPKWDVVLDPMKSLFFKHVKHYGSDLKNGVTKACLERIQALRAQQSGSQFTNPRVEHPLHQQDMAPRRQSHSP